MNYRKPEILRISAATVGIRLDNSLVKMIAGAELTDPLRMTVPAYLAVDDD